MPGWLIDESGNHTATAVQMNGGTAPTPSESIKKFGSSSAKFVRTSNLEGGGVSMPDSDDFFPTTNVNFTLQWWMFPQWSSFYSGIFGQRNGTNGHRARLNDGNRQLEIEFQTNSGHVGMNAGDPGGNAWHHVAIVRNASQGYWQIWRDGNRANTWSFSSGNYGVSLANVAAPFIIGVAENTSDPIAEAVLPWNGYIDGFHLEVGVARWDTVNFDAGALLEPTVTEYTKVLMNFNETFYQVQGTLSDDSRIIVIDEATRTVEHDAVESAGAYVVGVDDDQEKTIAAIRESDGKTLGYGRVLPTQI